MNNTSLFEKKKKRVFPTGPRIEKKKKKKKEKKERKIIYCAKIGFFQKFLYLTFQYNVWIKHGVLLIMFHFLNAWPCMMWMAHLLYQQSLHTKKNNPPFQTATYCLTEFVEQFKTIMFIKLWEVYVKITDSLYKNGKRKIN